MIDNDDDDDDDDDDDMIIISVFLGCVIFELRLGGLSSPFRVPPKKNKTPDHSLFFRCCYMAALFCIHH